jgi:hypothetical protein
MSFTHCWKQQAFHEFMSLLQRVISRKTTALGAYFLSISSSHKATDDQLVLLGPAATGTGTIALDPTFGSFNLLEQVSHEVNWFLWRKCLDYLDRNRFRVWTQ